MILLLILVNCQQKETTHENTQTRSSEEMELADELEQSLFEYIVKPWYPLIIDTIHGGYITDFTYDWQKADTPQDKELVQTSRHIWATSFLYEHYPERKEFLDYAKHGFDFFKKYMWDSEFGGFFYAVNEDGSPDEVTLAEKRVYGQAFGIYGLSQYYRVSKDPEALELVKKLFLWMEEHIHDHEYGGYHEFMLRDGTPLLPDSDYKVTFRNGRTMGFKDFNSSIHLMEAITQLYRVWPDSLVRERLEEMFYLVRDTFTHPDGYLQLYFFPDWTFVTDEVMKERAGEGRGILNHFTYGHDVETAYLLLETADILGMGNDEKTHAIAKRLMDHSLESGWDEENGGFYDAGKLINGEIRIINDHKSWWGIIEGFNALLMMHYLYPDDPNDYFGKFKKMWDYINTYLIDKKYGGWYSSGLDTNPGSEKGLKSHAWKTTYHNSRGMVNCIRMLRGEYSHH